MRSNRKILFGLLLIVAVVLLYGVFQWISSRTTQVASTNPANVAGNGNIRPVSTSSDGKIAVAAVDIPARSIITPEMLKLVDHAGPATGFITDPKLQANGFVTRVALPKGAQIRPADDFVGHISEVGIAAAIQPGMRAMVIPIANKPTLHDLVRIGNYVDVLASFDSQEARPIVEGVRVLAVDVFGNDYPEKSVAMRGPFKAPAPNDIAGVPAPPSGNVPPPDPNATPTPAPTAPPANQPRPDAALTVEVTQEQAARIQLAMQSNAAIDYLLLPGAPDVNTGGTVFNPEGTPTPGTATVTTVSVRKSQIAPYAESKKNTASNPTVTVKGGMKVEGIPSGPRIRETSIPLPPPLTGGDLTPVMPTGGTGMTSPQAPPVSSTPQTYTIPVYGDGKLVRNDTVLTPQD